MSKGSFTRIKLQSKHIDGNYISIGLSKKTGNPFIQSNSFRQNITTIHPSYEELQEIVTAIEKLLMDRLLGET